jgi:hypothetical protein
MDSKNENISDMATSHADINTGTWGSMHEIDWGTEDLFWRDNYASRPYARADRSYESMRPAYQYGVESARRHGNRAWSDVEGDLSRGWDSARGHSRSTWEEVKDAVKDAWDRVVHRK